AVLEYHGGDDLGLATRRAADSDEHAVVDAVRVGGGPGLPHEVPDGQAAEVGGTTGTEHHAHSSANGLHVPRLETEVDGVLGRVALGDARLEGEAVVPGKGNVDLREFER